MAPRRKAAPKGEWRGNIPHGSPAHAALLGLTGEADDMDPAERAKREKALATKPTTMSEEDAERKRPVNELEYERGEHIIAGFARQSRR